MIVRLALAALSGLYLSNVTPCVGAGRGDGLVYLRDIDPTIAQEIRYATEDNFTGRTVPGYGAGECLLRRSVAMALSAVQRDLRATGLSLKVFDCYRPGRAVRSFVAWAQAGERLDGPAYAHPAVPRWRLLGEGYIAAHSRHPFGTAVDLTLVLQSQGGAMPVRRDGCRLCTDAPAPRGGLDMGTDFDCFDPKSWTGNPAITAQQRANRNILVAAMARHGFRNFGREWWHFNFANGGTSFSLDVPIAPHGPNRGTRD